MLVEDTQPNSYCLAKLIFLKECRAHKERRNTASGNWSPLFSHKTAKAWPWKLPFQYISAMLWKNHAEGPEDNLCFCSAESANEGQKMVAVLWNTHSSAIRIKDEQLLTWATKQLSGGMAVWSLPKCGEFEPGAQVKSSMVWIRKGLKAPRKSLEQSCAPQSPS